MTDTPDLLPDWSVDQWFNTPKPISLADLRDKVVIIEAFQMLCPGCVAHGLPLAQQVHDFFPHEDVAVIGLHTVFEHHAAMTPVSLQAFLHEYRITFPVGVDTPGEAALPITMERYGRLAAHYFGEINPMKLGAEVANLAGGKHARKKVEGSSHPNKCDESRCVGKHCARD